MCLATVTLISSLSSRLKPSQYVLCRPRGGAPPARVPGQAHRRGGEAHQLRDPDYRAQAALLEDEDAGSLNILGQCPLLRHPRPSNRGRHHPLQDVHDRSAGHRHRQVNQVRVIAGGLPGL